MADVIFYDEEENSASVQSVKKVKDSFLSRLVIRSGLAKTVAQAEQVLLIIAILALLGSVGVVILGYFPIDSGGASPSAVSAATARLEVDQLQAEQAEQARESATAK